MKKLLLLSLLCLPVVGMQSKNDSPLMEHLKTAAAPVALMSGTLMTTSAITGGGCTLFPPTVLLIGGAYAMKKGYDWYYKKECLNTIKGK